MSVFAINNTLLSGDPLAPGSADLIVQHGPMNATLQAAKHILCAHYCDDNLDRDQVRRDLEHWERVAGDAARFPNADLDFIERFTVAALDYLALSYGELA